jgi:UDP:flavonoid glycosyltransferase YjiC (YdhE family)
MRIVIPTIGSRGDVQPFIALAQGLAGAGHAVMLASHPVMQTLVRSHGVAFHAIGPDIDLARKVADIQRGSKSAAASLVRAMRFSFDMLQRSHEDILTLCMEADLVVVSAQSAAGKNEADQLGVPHASVTLMPWAISWDDPARSLWRRTAYSLMDGLVSFLSTRPLNRIRRKQGLPPVGREAFTSLRLNLVPVSPAVFEPNPLWEPHHRIVGYWFAREPAIWEPPGELLAFLETGDPPVLISLGAMSLGDDDPKGTPGLVVEAVLRADVRAIIQGWDAALSQLPLPTGVQAIGSVPHSWLLPRCAAIVHHGGFGTTSAGLRAGIPALVIPHIADQYFWADKIGDLGVGPRPIRRSKLEVEGLAASLRQLIDDQSLRQRAASIGEQIRAEHGVSEAVREIEEEFL